jgi:hypothetical protein
MSKKGLASPSPCLHCARLFNDIVGITVPRESTPSRYPAGSMPTPPTQGRRVPITDVLSQTTSGGPGCQLPPSCCNPLTAIDEICSSMSVDTDKDLDL